MNTSKQTMPVDKGKLQGALRIGRIIFLAAIVVAGFYFFLAWQLSAWQLYVLGSVITAFCIANGISLPVIRHGRVKLGIWTILVGMYLVFPAASMLVADIGLIFAGAVIILVYVVASQTLSSSQLRRALLLSIPSALAAAAMDYIGLDYRLFVPQIQIFIPAITGVIVLIALFLVARQAWGSSIRNKIIVVMIAVLAPILIASAFFTVQTQRQDLEDLLLERAEASAITGAETIGHLFENAIENGDLTEEQVFDRDYEKFWEFDPSDDPNYDPETDPDPGAFDKYHTAYDSYTDENWQELIDSYLTSEDILFAAPADINGYVPTHNSRYSKDDGSVAYDRTKRIFDDPVGIAASRNTEPVLKQVYSRPGTDQTIWDVSSPIYVNGEHWGAFRVGVELAENQSRVVAATWRSVISTSVVFLAVIIFAWFFGNYISKPIVRLTNAAAQAAGGKLDQEIHVSGEDELSVLADAFNQMNSQLRETLGSLEQQVEDRTRALETSTEVSRRLSTILDQDRLVREVVEQLQAAFGYYHAHIYLYDDDKQNLNMVGGTGDAGRTMLARGHSIERGQGLVGRAAESREPVLVPDTSQAEGWLPNPLLPETRAELAVPITIGDEVLGVLDVQHNVTGELSAADADLIRAIANQVAVALQNAQAYNRAQRRAEREAQIGEISQSIQSAGTIEDVLKVAVSKLGQTLEAKRANVELSIRKDQT
jgi:putative methionine-R-sulfoxide reductase with GAF domain